jgi:hypothetical protein
VASRRKELFYSAVDGRIMAVEIGLRASQVSMGKPQALFQANYGGGPGWTYDASADGKSFLTVSQAGQQASEALTPVVNWPTPLKKPQ